MEHFDTITVSLSNGLRAAIRHTPSGRVAYTGIVVNAGSRDEAPDHHGLAHFVEHTVFKGTRRRNSWHISNRMECVGGELNAFTTKEITALYTVAPAGFVDRSADLLADLVAEASFPASEIDREREVVIEEINSYLDSPSESVFDRFEEIAFEGSGLAHNILGTPESVRSLSGSDCRAFIDRFYTPGNMALYCSSPENPKKVAAILERRFGHLDFPDNPPLRTPPPPMACFDHTIDEEGHQAHTIMGTRIFGRNDPRRHALFLLNNYLGGPGMNSRLNRVMRDKRGLCYTVESMTALFSDCGQFLVYFGCDPESVKKCRRLVTREIDALAQNTLSPARLEAIKQQYCGQLLVNSDNRENTAMSMGRSLLFYGAPFDVEQAAKNIREVSAEQFREAAEMIAATPLSVLTLT